MNQSENVPMTPQGQNLFDLINKLRSKKAEREHREDLVRQFAMALIDNYLKVQGRQPYSDN